MVPRVGTSRTGARPASQRIREGCCFRRRRRAASKDRSRLVGRSIHPNLTGNRPLLLRWISFARARRQALLAAVFFKEAGQPCCATTCRTAVRFPPRGHLLRRYFPQLKSLRIQPMGKTGLPARLRTADCAILRQRLAKTNLRKPICTGTKLGSCPVCP